jgi:hypothetical protein
VDPGLYEQKFTPIKGSRGSAKLSDAGRGWRGSPGHLIPLPLNHLQPFNITDPPNLTQLVSGST